MVNLDRGGDFRKLVTARAYRSEIILTAGEADHLELLGNFLFNLEDLGLEHYIVLM